MNENKINYKKVFLIMSSYDRSVPYVLRSHFLPKHMGERVRGSSVKQHCSQQPTQVATAYMCKALRNFKACSSAHLVQ
jgi:hypothetical protein